MRKSIRILFILLLVGTVCSLAHSIPQTNGARYGGGTLSGSVYGYNMYDEAIPLVWARVLAYSGNSLVGSASTGSNGVYVMVLPIGPLNVTVVHPGFRSQSRVVMVSEGGSAQMNFYLERSEIPIPEFETSFLPIMIVGLLAVTLALTRRHHRRIAQTSNPLQHNHGFHRG